MPLPVTNILMRRPDGSPAFYLSVIGITEDEFFHIPNEPASRLAARYPGYTPSMFDVHQQPEGRLRPPRGGKALTPRALRV